MQTANKNRPPAGILKKSTLILHKTDKEFCSMQNIETLYARHKPIWIINENGYTTKVTVQKTEDRTFCQIKLTNGQEHYMATDDKILCLQSKNTKSVFLKTTELTEHNFLPFNLQAYDEPTALQYTDGIIVGLYAVYGIRTTDTNNKKVMFDIPETDETCISLLTGTCKEKFGAIETKKKNGDRIYITYMSTMLNGLICDTIHESFTIPKPGCINHALRSRCINYSAQFRNGILDGIMIATHHGAYKCTNPSIQYTHTENGQPYMETDQYFASRQVISLLTSLGIPTETHADSTIKIYPYTAKTIRANDDILMDDNHIWFRIKTIQLQPKPEQAYFLKKERPDQHPISYMTLPNDMLIPINQNTQT